MKKVCLLCLFYILNNGSFAQTSGGMIKRPENQPTTTNMNSNIFDYSRLFELIKNYDFVLPFEEGLAQVGLNGKRGFIDKSGNLVVPLEYEFSMGFKNGYAVVKSNQGFGIIDKIGKEIVKCRYEGAGIFRDGLAPVKFNGKWGFVNSTGNQVVPCTYNDSLVSR